MIFRALLSSALLLSPIPAQDPSTPPGGFAIIEILDQDVTFVDGYRTRADLRLPDPAVVTSPTGWPVVALLHSWGDGRGQVASEAIRFAKRGYVTLTWDARGQGETMLLNTWGGAGGPHLMLGDMVELFHWSEAQLGPNMDFTRLAVWGKSFGAQHAWSAAAWNEQQLPQPRGPHTHFPKIGAVSPGLQNPDPVGMLMPDGNSFSAKAVINLFKNASRFEPGYRLTGQQAFLNQDFAAWDALVNTPWSQDKQLIRRSSTAVFAHNSWVDWWAMETPMVDAINSMPVATPRMVMISTFEGHGSVTNNLEAVTWIELEQRWFDHTLKGVPDEIAQQPPFRLATIPASVENYLTRASIWKYQQLASYPDTGLTQARRYYLRQDRTLSLTAPAAVEPGDKVSHSVATGYGPGEWLLDQACNSSVMPRSKCVAEQVLQSIPLSTVDYSSPAVTADEELLGRPVVALHLDSPAPNLQVHVVLFDEDPQGGRRWITRGFRAIRGRSAGRAVYQVVLGGVSYVLRAGHRYVIAVENHLYLRPPSEYHMLTAPFFESYDFDVLHSPSAASQVDLPIRAVPLFSARATVVTVSQSNGGSVPLEIDGGPHRTNQLYATLINLGGTLPGFSLFGAHVPLNWDPLTTAGLSAPGTVFQSFVGQLDARGQAQAAFNVAPGLLPPQLVGQLFSFVDVTFDATSMTASAATQVRVDP